MAHKVVFSSTKTANVIIETNNLPVPRKKEKIFIGDNLYKVKKVLYWVQDDQKDNWTEVVVKLL